MKIKYLLSGRALADSRYIKNIIDLWPSEYEPPSIINSLGQVGKSDIVITTGYLGMSYRLLMKHNPSRTFIIDNGLFSTPGAPFFRLLDGNLNTLFNSSNITSRLSIIKTKAMDTACNLNVSLMPSIEFLELPWSLPIKRICEAKLQEHLIEYNSLLSSKIVFSHSLKKDKAIAAIDKISSIPLLRMTTFNNISPLRAIPACDSMTAPNSTLAFWGYWFNKRVVLSKVNPFYSYHMKNKQHSISALLDYSSKVSFQMRDIAQYLFSNAI